MHVNLQEAGRRGVYLTMGAASFLKVGIDI
jgi:hypothetical protein